MQHVIVELDRSGLAAILFEPKSGGRVGTGKDSFFYPTNGEYRATLEAIDGLKCWLESCPPVAHVWTSVSLYGAYRAANRVPPWNLNQVRNIDTVFWLLGDPSISLTDHDEGLTGYCVGRICQLQDVLGRLQR